MADYSLSERQRAAPDVPSAPRGFALAFLAALVLVDALIAYGIYLGIGALA